VAGLYSLPAGSEGSQLSSLYIAFSFNHTILQPGGSSSCRLRRLSSAGAAGTRRLQNRRFSGICGPLCLSCNMLLVAVGRHGAAPLPRVNGRISSSIISVKQTFSLLSTAFQPAGVVSSMAGVVQPVWRWEAAGDELGFRDIKRRWRAAR